MARWVDELPHWNGLRVTVMGLGTFGGGLGATRFLVARGAVVTVTDIRPAEALTESLKLLESAPPARLQLGGHRHEDFQQADLIVVNPAVPRNCPYLNTAIDAGIPLTSEMNLLWLHRPGRVIGVTGSNGKSTTTALIAHLLKEAGRRTWLGGNIGGSLLPEVDAIRPEDWVVLELSSFQLDHLDHLRLGPEIAVVTNFRPNHLDRHGTLDDYRRAKQTLLRWQSPADVAVLNGDDDDVRDWPGAARRVHFGVSVEPVTGGVACEEPGLRTEEGAIDLHAPRFALPGTHNRLNAAAAVAAVQAAGLTIDEILAGLPTFRALPHRLEFVGEVEGRRFYNDSKATTAESSLCALEAFSEPIVLLAGGADKQTDLSEFATAAARRCRAIALMGATAPELERLMRRSAGDVPPLHAATSFEDAFAWGVARSSPGDVVLLSPACASYGWFRNFAERGERFTMLVRQLAAGRSAT